VLKNVALVGMMGVGKSSVGRMLGQRMGCRFVDLDEWIERQAGAPIWQLFRDRGERWFREFEEQQFFNVAKDAKGLPCVLATGGGTVLSARSRADLRDHWFTVWLDASVATLSERVRNAPGTRPVLQSGGTDVDERLRQLLRQRSSLYAECCHCKVQVDGRTVDDIVDEIVGRLGVV
jgi:shikimate kinase